jgi:hypothetical protein
LRITLNPSKLQLVQNDEYFDILDIETTDTSIKLLLEDNYQIQFLKCKDKIFHKDGNLNDINFLVTNNEISVNKFVKNIKNIQSKELGPVLIIDL